MPPPTLAEIIFPSQVCYNTNDDDAPHPYNHRQQSLSRVLGDLKRANLSVGNRLRSIRRDAAFVNAAAAALPGLPLVANERCGAWYVDPARRAASAYFKSTDGHTGQWKFSTRRLNLHLLQLIGEADGCIIVDSTRRGKRMPDALSKTVPTWCAVLNRALFAHPTSPASPSPSPSTFSSSFPPASSSPLSSSSVPLPPGAHDLFVPPTAVSPSEASQIAALLPSFVASFLALEIDLAPLRERLRGRPLRPVWVVQGSDHDYGEENDDDGGYDAHCRDRDLVLSSLAEEVRRVRQEGFHPVVCCTSSRTAGAGAGADTSGERGYVQGAGDDTENWALGLTPGVFWRFRDELLAAGEGELPGLIRELVARHEEERRAAMDGGGGDGGGGGGGGGGLVTEVAPGLFVGTLAAMEQCVKDGACVVALVPKVTEQIGWVKGPARMEVGLGKSKAASRLLRDALPQICDFVMQYLRRPGGGQSGRKVAVLCESGKDLSVGVSLAVLCWCFDNSGSVRPDDEQVSFNKAAIRVRLGHIVTALPEANPSRATLQSVNSFLMDWRR